MSPRSIRCSLLAPIAVLATTAAMVIGSGQTLAAVPTQVTIEVTTFFPSDGGTFTTSGAPLCQNGTTTDLTGTTGLRSGRLANYHVLKTFHCADGSGTFTALVQAHLMFGSPADFFSWTIVSGTGAYSNLHGSGSGVGDQLPGEVDDHFVGQVHFN